MKKKITKICFVIIMSVIALFFAHEVYQQEKTKNVLFTKLQQLEEQQLAAIEKQQRNIEEQQRRYTEYQAELSKWKQEVARIETQNRRAIQKLNKPTVQYAPPPPAMVIQQSVEQQVALASLPEPPKLPEEVDVEVPAITIELGEIRVELQNNTSWNTILQLIFTLLATQLGMKLINQYVKE